MGGSDLLNMDDHIEGLPQREWGVISALVLVTIDSTDLEESMGFIQPLTHRSARSSVQIQQIKRDIDTA